VICAKDFTMARSPGVEALWGQGRSRASLRYAPSGGLRSLHQSQHVFARLRCHGRGICEFSKIHHLQFHGTEGSEFFIKKKIVYPDKFCKILVKDLDVPGIRLPFQVAADFDYSAFPSKSYGL